jgi:acyl-CoA synthetase (AMP-forming)/AMP-acid ligase II
VDPRHLLQDTARRTPGRPAARCGAARLDYAALAEHATRVGDAIAAAGIVRGDRVGVLLPNCHTYLAAYCAAVQREWVLVPLNVRLSAAERRAILADSGAKALLADPAIEAGDAAGGVAGQVAGEVAAIGSFRVRALHPPAAENDAAAPPDLAHLYYTSGTTGKPKGVMLTRANAAAHAMMTFEALGFGPDDVWLHAAPMFHLADAWAVWTATAAGALHVFLSRFEAAAAFDLIATERVTITNLVPTMLMGLLAEAERRGRGLPSLRLLLSGGAPIAPSVVERIGSLLGCDYAQTYGLTETSPFLTLSLPRGDDSRLPADERLRRRARTGRAAPHVTLRVVQPAGAADFADVAADDRSVGEIVVRGATVTPGYWRDPEATRAAFLGGWFHTGDLGTIDAGGSINLVDRAKDVIVSGGESIYSTEVENVLYAHPAVREAAVFSTPDDDWGEAVRAAVVLKDAAAVTGDELIAFSRGRIAHYKCPRAVDFLPALPRTGSGKIDKKGLREPFWRGRARRIN